MIFCIDRHITKKNFNVIFVVYFLLYDTVCSFQTWIPNCVFNIYNNIYLEKCINIVELI